MRAHTITTTIVVCAVCVLAIPANASADPGGDSGYSSLNSISPPVSEPSGYSSLNSISPPVSEPSSPNESGSGTVGSGYSSVSAIAGPTAVDRPTTVSGSQASPADGFDWGDAALGAGAAMALAALGGAALLTVRRRTAMSPSTSTS